MHREEAGLEQTNQSDTKRVVQFILTYKTKSHMDSVTNLAPELRRAQVTLGKLPELKYTLSG